MLLAGIAAPPGDPADDGAAAPGLRAPAAAPGREPPAAVPDPPPPPPLRRSIAEPPPPGLAARDVAAGRQGLSGVPHGRSTTGAFFAASCLVLAGALSFEGVRRTASPSF